MPDLDQIHRVISYSPYSDGYCCDCGCDGARLTPTCTPRDWPGKVHYPDSFMRNKQATLPLTRNETLERTLPQGELPTDVTPGTVWRHRNGNLYTVCFLANENERPGHECTVVYVGPTARMWTRPLRDWHRSMTLHVSPQGSA
jgi:hypothetical protein